MTKKSQVKQQNNGSGVLTTSTEQTTPPLSVVPTAPPEIIKAFNIHGDTKLHQNQSRKRSIPDDVRRDLMNYSREIINQWMASGIVDDELKAKCHALAAKYNQVWIW